MLELLSFSRMTLFTIQFESRDQIFWLMSKRGNMKLQSLFQNIFTLWRLVMLISTN